MNRILRTLVMMFSLLALVGCTGGNAGAVQAYVEDQLTAGGCEYEIIEVEVEDMQVGPDDLANGTASAETYRVIFEYRGEGGEMREGRTGTSLMKGDSFDATNIDHTATLDTLLRMAIDRCVPSDN